MTHVHFVINPKAGRGKSIRVWKQVQNHLQTIANTYDFHYSHSNIGESLPSRVLLGEDSVVVAVGGDGSVHSVGQIAVEHRLRFAVVAAGTGNDFVRNTGCPTDVRGAVENIFTGVEQPTDVLRTNQVSVLNAVGYGLDAEIVSYIERKPWLKRLGPLGYAVVLPVALYKHRRFSVTVCNDNTEAEFHDVSLAVVSNGASFGGGMLMSPTSNMRDGLMELCIVSGLPKLKLLGFFPLIYSGKHTRLDNYKLKQVQSVAITFEGSMRPSQLDGEPGDLCQQVKVELKPGALRLIAPAGTSAARLV